MKFLSSSQLSEHRYKTPEGYLVCLDCILARTGSQEYKMNDLFEDGDDTDVNVYRNPEEVFSEKTLASFENKPFTNEHPEGDVNPENFKDLSVGFVRDIRKSAVDGKDVMIGNIIVTDPDTIKEIEDGTKIELSCGYDCDVVKDSDGHYNQINIRGNHVALCEHGRAGNARIIDSNNVKDEKIIYRGISINSFTSSDGRKLYEVQYNNKREDWPEYYNLDNAKHYVDLFLEKGERVANNSWKQGDSIKDDKTREFEYMGVKYWFDTKDNLWHSSKCEIYSGKLEPADIKIQVDRYNHAYDSINDDLSSEVRNWWRKVESANSINRWGFNINNTGANDEDMLSAMFDMISDLKNKDNNLYQEGKRIYNKYSKYSQYKDSKVNDIEPRANESKEDFISRFMSETKSEYPDEKQRLAVAYSYWNKRHDSIDDMGYFIPGRRIPAHNEYSNRISYNNLINTFDKVMKSASDGDVKILIGQLEELKKDYEVDINNKAMNYNETKMHYKKYKDIVNKYKNSKISNEFSNAVNNFINYIKDSIHDEYVVRKSEVNNKNFLQKAKSLGFDVEETNVEYILRGGNDDMYKNLMNDSNSKIIENIDKDIHIEYDYDDGKYYIASKTKKCPRAFNSSSEAKGYYLSSGTYLREELVNDSDKLEELLRTLKDRADDFTESMTNEEEKNIYSGLYKLEQDIISQAEQELSSAKNENANPAKESIVNKLLDMSKTLDNYARKAKNKSAEAKLIALSKDLYRCYDRNRKYKDSKSTNVIDIAKIAKIAKATIDAKKIKDYDQNLLNELKRIAQEGDRIKADVDKAYKAYYNVGNYYSWQKLKQENPRKADLIIRVKEQKEKQVAEIANKWDRIINILNRGKEGYHGNFNTLGGSHPQLPTSEDYEEVLARIKSLEKTHGKTPYSYDSIKDSPASDIVAEIKRTYPQVRMTYRGNPVATKIEFDLDTIPENRLNWQKYLEHLVKKYGKHPQDQAYTGSILLFKDSKVKDENRLATIEIDLSKSNAVNDLNTICKALNTTYKIVKHQGSNSEVQLHGNVSSVVDDLRSIGLVSRASTAINYIDSKVKDATSNECIEKIKSTSIPEGMQFQYGDMQTTLVQIQNVGIDKVAIDLTGKTQTTTKTASHAWGRIWKNGKLIFSEKDALNIIRAKMVEKLRQLQDSCKNK